jgi:GDPmannose 4,6-dehydratase
MAKTAIITGVLGMDGSLLADYLLARGYAVTGIVRPGSAERTRGDAQKSHLLSQVKLVETDLLSEAALIELLGEVKPDEFYHLAACHHSSEHGVHFQSALHNTMLETNFVATSRILHAIKGSLPECRFLYASTSQMFTPTSPGMVINEDSRRAPPTYYGLTKSLSMDLIRFFREKHGVWGVTAVLCNHESRRRAPAFLSRKVTQGAAHAAAGLIDALELRDIGSRTDWSSAEDFVAGMHLMLGAAQPNDYMLGSRELHSVAELAEIAFAAVGLDWKRYVKYQKNTVDGNSLIGDSSRIRSELGWKPAWGFKALIEDMVRYDAESLANGNRRP